MDLAARIDTYLDHLRVERALSKNTLESYARDLNALAARLGDDARAEDVTEGDVAGLLAANAKRGFGARSSARQLSAIRGFFKFLVRERIIDEDPTALLDRPRLGRRLPRNYRRRLTFGQAVAPAWLAAVPPGSPEPRLCYCP